MHTNSLNLKPKLLNHSNYINLYSTRFLIREANQWDVQRTITGATVNRRQTVWFLCLIHKASGKAWNFKKLNVMNCNDGNPVKKFRKWANIRERGWHRPGSSWLEWLYYDWWASWRHLRGSRYQATTGWHREVTHQSHRQPEHHPTRNSTIIKCHVPMEQSDSIHCHQGHPVCVKHVNESWSK